MLLYFSSLPGHSEEIPLAKALDVKNEDKRQVVSMLKIFSLFLSILIFLLPIHCFAQEDIIAGNRRIIDSLKKVYYTTCSSYNPSLKATRNILHSDRKLFARLNDIYHYSEASEIIKDLKSAGCELSELSNWKDENGKEVTVYGKKGRGNVHAMLNLIRGSTGLEEVVIYIYTGTKFYCNTEKAFKYHYIDFMYLDKLIKYIKFPLSVAASNKELISVMYYQ